MSSIDLVQQLAQQQHVFCLRWNNHSSNLLHYLQHLQENESLTNVTLVCEGGELFYAHQSVLSASSPYFESIFNSCLHHGANHNHPQGGTIHPIIFLKDVKGYEMRGLIDFMYRGEVNISQGCLNGFLKTAESLGIRGLTEREDEDTDSGNMDTIDSLTSAFRSRACKRRRRNGSNGSHGCGSGDDGSNSCYKKQSSNSTSREREVDRDSETEVQATECSSSRSVPSPNITKFRRNSATSSCTTTTTGPTVIHSSPPGVISLVKKDKYQTSSASLSASSSPASSCPCPKNLSIDPRELLEPLTVTVHHDEHEHENESSADDHDHDHEHDHDERDHHEEHKAASETLANLSEIGLHTKIFKTSSKSSTNCSSTTTSSSTLIMRTVTSPSTSPHMKNHKIGCIRVSSKPINIIGSPHSNINGRDHHHSHSHHRKSLGNRSSKVNSHSYVCSLCSHEYPRESTLLNHLKVYHKNNI